MVEFRVLGATVKPRLPWVSVVLVSGNNLAMTDDMVRRSLVARLEPQEENPETRTGFAHEDLLGWCLQDRPRLIAAALTVLRAYASHGYPSPNLGTMQSFNAWSRLVPGAIAFAGGGSLLASRARNTGSGIDEVAAVGTILSSLPAMYGSAAQSASTRAIIGFAYPAPGRNEPPDGLDELREAIETLAPSRLGTPDANRLGRALSRYVGRWIGGRKLTTAVVRSTKTWKVETR